MWVCASANTHIQVCIHKHIHHTLLKAVIPDKDQDELYKYLLMEVNHSKEYSILPAMEAQL